VNNSSVSNSVLEKLKSPSVATLTSQLLLRGYRNTFVAGLQASRPDLRLVGRAFTLRYVPTREDVGFNVAYDNDKDVQRLAVEGVSPGDILVIDARGVTSAASFGHIIATRLHKRGAAGLVTDGALRDSHRFGELEMPVYFRSPHATTSSVAHYAVDMNVPIGCGGVLCMPGDIVVGDAEGVVVVPQQVAADIVEDAIEQEIVEDFALARVSDGESIRGLYPLAAERKDEYTIWRQTSGRRRHR
jgi:regulator of RNase E activity RraA